MCQILFVTVCNEHRAQQRDTGAMWLLSRYDLHGKFTYFNQIFISCCWAILSQILIEMIKVTSYELLDIILINQ